MGSRVGTASAIIYGRYILSMQFNIAVDSAGTGVKATSDPEFFLREVSNISKLQNGQTSITYNTESEKQFGVEEWKVLQSHNGDLGSLGIAVQRDGRSIADISDC